jgi:hypothetical protein
MEEQVIADHQNSRLVSESHLFEIISYLILDIIRNDDALLFEGRITRKGILVRFKAQILTNELSEFSECDLHQGLTTLATEKVMPVPVPRRLRTIAEMPW